MLVAQNTSATSKPRGTSVPRRELPRGAQEEGVTEVYERLGDVKRFTLYEARSHFYLAAHNTSQTRFRVLKIDRVPPIMAQAEEPESPPKPQEEQADAKVAEQGAAERPEHKRTPSMPTDVQSIVEDAPQARPNAPSGTLSSEITELASSLAPADPPPGEAAPVPHAPLTSISGLRYLSTDDPEIPHLRQSSEWKAYTTDGKDQEAKEAAPAPADVPERTVPPIAALGSTRSPKHTNRASIIAPDAPAPPESEPPRKEANAWDPSDASAWKLNVSSDSVEYSASEMTELLDTIREGNRSTGGLKEVGRFFGLIGFVRFTAGYYMVLISQRSAVALLGGHYIYHCDETQVIPVCHSSILSSAPGRSKLRDQTEAQMLRTFRQVDLSKNFYFSYTYDITRTLQENMTGPRTSTRDCSAWAWSFNEKCMWNFHLLRPAFDDCRRTDKDPASPKRPWVLPLVHGFVDQAKLVVLGRTIYVTLIARRSRHFAGARFHKRGTDLEGHVANDVETEQIVNEPVTSPFFAPRHQMTGERPYRPSPHFTSYVMIRGSIPIYWTQDSTNMSPRPPIAISVVDPYFAPAMRHFDSLFRTYGTPVIVLNLIKSKEKQPRESKLLHAYSECVQYLNQFLPDGSDGGKDRRIKYVAWDMSRASKSRDQDVIGILETLAEDTLHATRFFHSGSAPQSFRQTPLESARSHEDGRVGIDMTRHSLLLQHGVARVNCVDCLDRTNAAQFVLGKTALGHQLHALGLLQHPHLSFDSDAVNMLTEMYHDLGDTIALQYGGSALAHTTDTYRKINHWTSHSRDMLEGLKRYYANSFADADKQASIDLFLGQDKCTDEISVADDKPTPTPVFRGVQRYLAHDEDLGRKQAYINAYVNSDAHFWDGYYRPSLFTDLQRHHAYKMTAVHQQPSLLPGEAFPALNSGGISPLLAPSELGPVAPLSSTAPSNALRRGKGHATFGPRRAEEPPTTPTPRRTLLGGVRRWIAPQQDRKNPASRPASKYEAHTSDAGAQSAAAPQAEPSSLELAVAKTLRPVISKQEQREYQAYTMQFLQLQFQRSQRTTDADMQIYGGAIALPTAAMQCEAPGVVPPNTDPALATYMQVANMELVAGVRPVPQPSTQRIVSAPAITTPSRLAACASVATPETLGAPTDTKVRSYAAWLHMAHVK